MATSPNTKRDEKQSSNDLYITPKEALDAIWPHILEDLDATTDVLDPCSGLGDISNWLKYHTDANIIANELYICPDKSKLVYVPEYSEDFLAEINHLPSVDVIVANPPYNRAMDFVLKGFEHAPIQWHFLRLSFLEGQKRYEELFRLNKLSDVYIFTYRVSCDKGYDREETANSVCYTWYRFDHYHNAPPKLHWLTK